MYQIFSILIHPHVLDRGLLEFEAEFYRYSVDCHIIFIIFDVLRFVVDFRFLRIISYC